jgi:hypothetical protein
VWELEGYGPPPTSEHTLTGLSGRWICGEISRHSLLLPDTTVTLHRRQKAKAEPAHDVRGREGEDPSSPSSAGVLATASRGELPSKGTPKQIIDGIVLPLARANGISVTAASVAAANAQHGPTVSGSRSDHQGPPEEAWAADMSNGVLTREERKLAADLAARFSIPWSGTGLATVTHGDYRYQLIYGVTGAANGGDHRNHVHFGVRFVGSGGPARASTPGRLVQAG